MGVRGVSLGLPSLAPRLTAFLFSEECCDAHFDFCENFESSDVFPVESPGLGMEDLPLPDSALVDGEDGEAGEDSGVISKTPRSREIEMILGRLLNFAR